MKRAIVIYEKGCFEMTGFEINIEKNMILMYSYGHVVSSISSEDGTSLDYLKEKLTDAIVNDKIIELKQLQ